LFTTKDFPLNGDCFPNDGLVTIFILSYSHLAQQLLNVLDSGLRKTRQERLPAVADKEGIKL
jgi:hypothetical protein